MVIYKRNYFDPKDPENVAFHSDIVARSNVNIVNPILNTTAPVIGAPPNLVDFTAAEPIRRGNKVQILSSDEPYKVVKIDKETGRWDAYVFEFTDPAKMNVPAFLTNPFPLSHVLLHNAFLCGTR